MKILHLMGPLQPSGMERMFVSGAPHFAAAGVDAVIVGQGDIHPYRDELTDAGYRVVTIPSLKGVAGVKAWIRVLRRERPDIVHIHTEGAFLLSALGTRAVLPRTPIVRTVHNVFMPHGRAFWSRVVQGAIADRVVARFIAVSPDVKQNEVRFNRDAQVILNWVDDRFFALRDQRSLRNGGDRRRSAVIVGNSSRIKNQVVALRALAKGSWDVYFHGDESGATNEEIGLLDQLATAGRLRHRGVGDPGQSLVEASVFVMPSKHEGMSIALAEALTVGVPAIVNDVPGQRWSEQLANVYMIADDQAVWDQALFNLEKQGLQDSSDPDEFPLDLSAGRGTLELTDLYSQLIAL